MTDKFTPINLARAKKIEPVQEEESSSLPDMIWANSKAEADLISKMSEKELEQYLAERDGGKE